MKKLVLVAAVLAVAACSKSSKKEAVPSNPVAKVSAEDQAFTNDLSRAQWVGKCYQTGAITGAFVAGSERHELLFVGNEVTVMKVAYSAPACKGKAKSSDVESKMEIDVKSAAKDGSNALINFYDVKMDYSMSKTDGHDGVKVRTLSDTYKASLSEDGLTLTLENDKSGDFFGMDNVYTRPVDQCYSCQITP